MYTLTPVVKRLLIITGAVHILALVLLNFNNNFIENSFSLVPKKVLENFQIWRLLSYGFLHDLNGFWHLLGNCLALFFFGCPLEQRWEPDPF